ncbi:hypothetical protein [Micromonospora sp. NPDC092111]
MDSAEAAEHRMRTMVLEAPTIATYPEMNFPQIYAAVGGPSSSNLPTR